MRAKVPFYIIALVMVITVLLLILSVSYFKIPLYIPLLIGYISTFVITLLYKIKAKDLLGASYKGIKSISAIFSILILIGVLIAIWSSSGTIDTLVYYGLAVIYPKYIVVTSFVVSALISMILGTSVGTASTIGIAFMSMAEALGINSSLIAGAIVSGAFVGDRTSPLSSAAHINTVVTETNYYDNLQELLKTLIPVFLITVILYLTFVENDISISTEYLTNNAREQIKLLYNNISLWLLLPALSIMILAVFKISIQKNLIIGILLGALLAYIFQGNTFLELINYAVFGFAYSNGNIYGGAWNMFNQVLLVIVAGAYYGLLESTGLLSILLERITTGYINKLSIIRKTIFISISAAILSSTQIMGIIVPGKVMLKTYKQYKMESKLLNRIISDTGMVVSGLVPWNLNAILLGIALNISVIDYLPYAYLLMILPLYTYLQCRLKFAKEVKNTGRNLENNLE